MAKTTRILAILLILTFFIGVLSLVVLGQETLQPSPTGDNGEILTPIPTSTLIPATPTSMPATSTPTFDGGLDVTMLIIILLVIIIVAFASYMLGARRK